MTERVLTRRQRDVLALKAKGLTEPEIAARLSVSENTVKFHAQNAYRALGAENSTHAVAIAIACGELFISMNVSARVRLLVDELAAAVA